MSPAVKTAFFKGFIYLIQDSDPLALESDFFFVYSTQRQVSWLPRACRTFFGKKNNLEIRFSSKTPGLLI